jgi:hypothetical protein
MTSTAFPRRHVRSGNVDDGTLIGRPERCRNCGSDRYYQTVSVEHCPACGLRCDYWGEGANDIYKAMMENQAHAARQKEMMDSIADDTAQREGFYDRHERADWLAQRAKEAELNL